MKKILVLIFILTSMFLFAGPIKWMMQGFASTLTVDGLKDPYAASKDSDFFQIWSNTSWNVTTPASWLTIKTPSGSGNALKPNGVYVVSSVNSGSLRSSYVYITTSNNKIKDSIIVTQSATSTYYMNASTNNLSLNSNSGSYSITVTATSGLAWTVGLDDGPKFAVLTSSTGIGNGTISFTYPANTSSSSRTQVLTFTSNLGLVGGQYIYITQAGESTGVNYYVSTTGSDSNNGTSISTPFATLTKLASVITAGQSAYILGGTYSIGNTQMYLQNLTGTSTNPINISNYPGQTVIITRSGTADLNPAIYFYNNNYVNITGLNFTGFPQQTDGNPSCPWRLENSNNCTFTLCNWYGNGASPECVAHNSTGNSYINCDFHTNFDPYTPNGNGYNGPYSSADCCDVSATDSATVNYFTGCRAWYSCGDGFDTYRSCGNIIFTNCWAWQTGYIPGIGPSTSNGGSWGFKLGISECHVNSILSREVINCIAAYNTTGGIGLDDNTVTEPLCHVYNCFAYNNGSTNYDFGEVAGISHVLHNNLSLGSSINESSGDGSLIDSYNSWDSGYSISSADFVSLDTTGMSGSRNSNGSLPCLNFGQLKNTSPLYTGGTNLSDGDGTIMGAITTQCSSYTLSVAPNPGTLTSTGGNTSFTVTSNTSWTATLSTINSITILSGISGSGNGTIVVTCPANTSYCPSLTNSLVVSGTGVSTVTIPLTQPNELTALSIPIISFTSNTASSITIGISNVDANVTNANLEYSPDGITWNSIYFSPRSAIGSSQTISGLTSSTSYHIKLLVGSSGSYCNSNNSDYSNVLIQSTLNSVSTPCSTTNYTIASIPYSTLGYSFTCDSLIYSGSTSNAILSTTGAIDIENSAINSTDANATALILGGYTGSTATSVKIKYNVFNFTNSTNYGILIGSDSHVSNNQPYSGAQFIGNWLYKPYNPSDNAECLMLGDNSGGVWEYNFLNNCNYGIPTKGYGFNNSAGVIAYNCFRNCGRSLTVKGINNTNILNNTFYGVDPGSNSFNFISIVVSDDGLQPSTGTVIKNNIFYSNCGDYPSNTYLIYDVCLSGLVSDYNVFYDSQGVSFRVYVTSGGVPTGAYTDYSFSEWQSLGYDTHSVVINPNLNSITLVPASALNYGTTTIYNIGIDPSNVWNRSTIITKTQNTQFQVGAFVK